MLWWREVSQLMDRYAREMTHGIVIDEHPDDLDCICEQAWAVEKGFA